MYEKLLNYISFTDYTSIFLFFNLYTVTIFCKFLREVQRVQNFLIMMYYNELKVLTL